MKKLLTVMAISIPILTLGGCDLVKPSELTTVDTGNVEISTGSVDIGSVVENSGTNQDTLIQQKEKEVKLPENWKELSEEELATYLPECEFEELKPTEIINIDDVVQNCSSEILSGNIKIDGMGSSNVYFYLTKQGLAVVDNIDIGEYGTITCKNKETIFAYSNIINKETDTIIKNKLKRGLLKAIYLEDQNYYIKSFCNICTGFNFTPIEGKNNHYIVAGIRDEYILDENKKYIPPKIYYVIDNQLYNRGDNSEYSWYFHSFQGNNMIVKKIQEKKGNNIIIKTCEIMLK